MAPDARGLEFLAAGDADGDGVGRSARSGAGAAGVPVRLRRRRRRSRDAAVARGDERGRARAPSWRRWPRSSRRRRGSIASGSARSRTEVKARTGQKGKALFHPIRVALTGPRRKARSSIWRCRRSIAARSCRRTPAFRAIVGCRERAAAFAARSATLAVRRPRRVRTSELRVRADVAPC